MSGRNSKGKSRATDDDNTERRGRQRYAEERDSHRRVGPTHSTADRHQTLDRRTVTTASTRQYDGGQGSTNPSRAVVTQTRGSDSDDEQKWRRARQDSQRFLAAKEKQGERDVADGLRRRSSSSGETHRTFREKSLEARRKWQQGTSKESVKLSKEAEAHRQNSIVTFSPIREARKDTRSPESFEKPDPSMPKRIKGRNVTPHPGNRKRSSSSGARSVVDEVLVGVSELVVGSLVRKLSSTSSSKRSDKK